VRLAPRNLVNLATVRRAVVIVVVSLVVALPAAPTQASHARNCGVIENVKGKRDYRVRAGGVRCKFARGWSKAYIRRGARPGGWSCSGPTGNITFYCRNGSDFYYAQRA
jgi:hypothetical protein